MKRVRKILRLSALSLLAVLCADGAGAQEPASALYQQLKAFDLSGGSAVAENVVLKRDRGEMTFTSGTLYFSAPVAGKVRGAVFIGQGTFRAEAPPSLFEKENLQRMLKADVAESTFETAVLRFTDDAADALGAKAGASEAAPAEAQKLATEFEGRFVRETGANVASRLLLSILNNEQPGVFVAQFDKGQRGRFTYVLDQQGRIPTQNFNINGGEKGIVFAYNANLYANDVWMAFYAQPDYQAGRVNYSDAFDLVETPNYGMNVDLREPRRAIKVAGRVELVTRTDGVRAIPFALSESLPEYDQLRKKKGMRIVSAKLDGTSIETIQEEWEGGFTVVLPTVRKTKEHFTLEMEVEGDFVNDREETYDCHYPLVNGEWYPRHGYLTRSKYDITFRHAKKHRVAGPGTRVSEEAATDSPNEVVTQYRIDEPVSFVTFALGPYTLYKENRKLVEGELPTELFSLAGSRDIHLEFETSQGIARVTVPMTIKEDFVLAEMGNAVDYMGAMFGKYPYPMFRAAYHPFGFGQGFATMLAIPNADTARKETFVFISHETAHQWWGNVVAWRSYRDQWLSEGFAEYSGLLYMSFRTKNQGNLRDLLMSARESLRYASRTQTGIGKERVNEIGPIILGGRLRSSRSLNAYHILTYNKGALVLRMLHFLFTNPVDGNGEPFFEMMRDFVNRHRNQSATTESFMRVASEHFVKTPVAQKYGLKDLNWFFRQWVYQTHLPAYRMEYQTQQQPDGSVVVQGVIHQEYAPPDWFMPLPLVFEFDKNQRASGTVHVLGARTPFSIPLPMKPRKVELDPGLWVLSEKTTTQGR